MITDKHMPDPGLGVKMETVYNVECYDEWHRLFGFRICKRRKPKLKWKDSFKNTVVTVGLNKLLDATFKTGLASPAWYVGLKDTGSISASDTMASHSGWTEDATYSDSTRPAFTPGSISGGSVDNSAAKAVFHINGSSTIYGAFLTTSNVVSGTTGTLYGAGDFGSSRPVTNGDVLNVTVTLTAS